MIARYRVTLEVPDYEAAVAVLTAYIAARGVPPDRSLIQALDAHGEPLWTPPPREGEADR